MKTRRWNAARWRGRAAIGGIAGWLVLGTAARAQQPVSFSGYGELHFNNPSDGVARTDFHRLVLGFSYAFSDAISMDAELDFEHAFTEPELEFAYLDLFWREALSFRAGAVLMPVGPLNEFHEPPLFYSVERPYVQKFVIPTTWQEPGAGVFGTLAEGAFAYRAYVVGGLDASAFRGVDGVRKGRQSAAEAKSSDGAVVARVEYSPLLGVKLGASGYAGRAAQGDDALGDAGVAIAEIDARARVRRVEVKALIAGVFVGDADRIAAGDATGSPVGERIAGWYAEVAHHGLGAWLPNLEADLVVFGRYERIDTHDAVPDGFVADPGFDRRAVTFGAALLPIPDVAIKADIELWEDGASRSWRQVNVGVGFMY